MRNRTLALLLGATLVFGGAACSDDEDGDETTELEDVDSGSDNGSGESEQDSDDSGDSAGGSADVEAYCDAVEAFAEEAADVMADPTNASGVADLQAEATELQEQSAALSADAASLGEEDIERLNECTTAIAEALTPGG